MVCMLNCSTNWPFTVSMICRTRLMHSATSRRQLPLLVGSGHSHQADIVALQQRAGYRLADVSLISHSIQVSMLLQQLVAPLQVTYVGGHKHEVEDYPSQRDQELHLVTEDSLLLGRDAPKGSSIDSPLSRSLRSQMELHQQARASCQCSTACRQPRPAPAALLAL